MIKLTLDTNCIINLLDYQSESAISVDELAEILRYGLEGDVNIAITTRVDSDVSKDKNQDRKNEILKRISMFPIIGSVARLDISKLDSGDVLSGKEHQSLEDEIKKIVFPNLKKDDSHYSNKINDVDHLIGHKINQRDVFVTDDQQILKKAETLESSIGIKVMDPKKALEYINLQANQVVLAQEFSEKFAEYKSLILTAISKGIDAEQMTQYEELRKWMIRKLPAIKDGLLNFKFRMVSVPTGGQRIFGQDDVMSLQMFNDRLNGILRERDPLKIPQVASTHRLDYTGYRSEREQINMMISFINSVEDSLLGYLGALESK
ncbi:MAG: hypothetical protein WC905_02710 [Patescibacteria group bacterium]|jgi:hypothetical protein